MSQTIVTKDTINALLENEAIRAHVIGRALVVLFNRQTASEKAANDTNRENSIGFTKADAHSGCITAKTYLKHHTLAEWQIRRWMRPNRIAKYHRQLNEAACAKASANEHA